MISDQPRKTTVDRRQKSHKIITLLHIKIQGHLNLRKHEHSDFDPYVEKLTSGSSTELISPFGGINFVAVM